MVTPGLVDIQVHFREPGREDAETIETGSRAAALGGLHRGRLHAEHRPAARRRRSRAVDLRSRARASACATCGRPVASPRAARASSSRRSASCTTSACASSPTTATAWPTRCVMRHAFEYAAALPGAVLAQHAEDPALVRGGHMHEGAWSARLGIPGRPAEAESTIVARDLQLAARTGGRYHVLHMSCAASADLVRAAKADGVRVTAECTPQHLVLTDESCSRLRPGVQDEPAAARAGRRRRAARRAPRRHDRRDRHRPRAAHAREQGRAVRGGAARACSASRPRWRSCSPRSSSPAC